VRKSLHTIGVCADPIERTLDDGLRLRLIRPDDEPRLISLYDRLSRHSAYQRFFAAMRRLPTDWAHFLANVDYERRLALVIERDTDDGIELIAVARYEPTPEPGVVEIALVVQDAWQGRGLGRLLLDELLAAAHARGHRRFRAYVLAENSRMLRMLSRYTRVLERGIQSGVAELLLERLPEKPPA
jgi:RimJ/RimL family protein N-acetyltransferase